MSAAPLQAAMPTFGGMSAPSIFGAASSPAFGTSAPAFGATPAFGSTAPVFGGTGFGASTPAFGAAAPAFGSAVQPAFGATAPFGSSTAATGVLQYPNVHRHIGTVRIVDRDKPR